MFYLKVILFVIIFSLLNLNVFSENIKFLNDDKDEVVKLNADSGYTKLIWALEKKNNEKNEYILEVSKNKDFTGSKIIYKGPNEAEYITGLNEGIYYYRVKSNHSDWSKTLTLTVKYKSLKLAWALFSIGAVVFISIVLFILIGNRKENI